ncbi:GldG family protein [bacterium]|nr:GldG family protein [bacterium]MCP5462842.1 GldG family protein [bacterium]
MKRKLELTTHSSLFILIVLGVLVLINGISVNSFFRIDLTENKQFTISDPTKKILETLDDLVTIKLYFSKNLPPVMMIGERAVRDLLDEYRAYSNGNIVVKKEDPASSPELEQQVHSIGIPQVQMTFREKDKVEVKNGYLGMAIFYGDKTEVIPIVQDIDNLEYDLTSAIRKVTANKVFKIGFLTGHDERDLRRDFSAIQGALEQQYETEIVSVANGEPIPDEIETLIIAGPKKDFSQRDLFEIDQFIMKGKKLIVLMDTIDINFEAGLSAAPRQHTLLGLLEHYGIRINTDLVLDRYNDRLTYSESPDGRVQYITTVQYPFFVKAFRNNFDQDNPVLRGIESLTFTWTSSIEILNFKLKNADVTKLIQSSEYSWVQKGRFNLTPKQDFNHPPDEEKQFLISAIVSNEFPSYFAGKEIPAPLKDNDSSATVPPVELPDDSAREIITQSPATQILAVGNSFFITSDNLRRFGSNGIFFLNAVDWMTQGEALIGIRTRSITERPIKEMSDASKGFARFINIFGMAAGAVCFGIIFTLSRKRRRKLYEELIAHS